MKKFLIIFLLLLSSCYSTNKLVYFDNSGEDYCCVKKDKNIVSCEYNYIIDIRDITSDEFLDIITEGLTVTDHFCTDKDFSSVEITTDYDKILVFKVKSSYLKDYTSGIMDKETLFKHCDLSTRDLD